MTIFFTKIDLSKFIICFLFLILNFVTFTPANSQSVSLESVEGSTGRIGLNTDELITFNIKIYTDSINVQGLTNGFRIYSPDGANWTTTVIDTLYPMQSLLDLFFGLNMHSVTGSDADTVSFGGVRLFKPGIPPYFNEVVYSITIGPINSSEVGKSICLDSSYYPPHREWIWSDGLISIYPSWDGPHCFIVCDENGVDTDSDGIPDNCDVCPTDSLNDPDKDGICNSIDNCPDVYNPNQLDLEGDGLGDLCCCRNIRGNVDYDINEILDIADVVSLVAFSFQNGPEPPCIIEADFDGSGGETPVDISDLVMIVHYLFGTGFPPAHCPE